MGPLFCKYGNRKSYQKETWAPGFDKIRNLYYAFRIFNIKGISTWIKIDAYTNSIPKKCRV